MRVIITIILIFVTACWLQATQITDGVMYDHIVQSDPALSIHIVTVDPNKAQLVLEAAHNKCKSTQKVTEIAKRTGAIAAINGGFFDFGQKSKMLDLLIKLLDWCGYNNSNTFPVFSLKINDHWFSLSPIKTGVIAWNNGSKEISFDTIKQSWKLFIEDEEFPVAEINKPYASGPIIYTLAYDVITERKKNVTEIVVEDGSVIDIAKGGGSWIPQNGFVYAIEDHKNTVDISFVRKGFKAILVELSEPAKRWGRIDYILGSTPLLLKDGNITDTIWNGSSTFFTTLHPRTAIGIKEDGQWILVVVDGRSSTSVGMTLLQLAGYMKRLGCVDALNLDGGGSSVMVINDHIVNDPSGREYSLVRKERNCSNAILVLPRK